MAAPTYPAFAASSSASAKNGITHTAQNGVDVVTLPVIVVSNPAAGQAKVGDLIYLQANELAGGIVADANTGLAFDTLSVLQAAFYVASANLVWKRAGFGVPLTAISVAPGNGAGPVAFGSANVPAAITTPAAPAAWVPVILPDGTIGFSPVWK